MEHAFTVSGKNAGERIDKFLCLALPNMSRSRIKTLIDDGRVLINRKRVLIAGWELEPEDFIEVRIPPGFGREENDRGDALAPDSGRDRKSAPGEIHHEDHAKIRDSIERHVARKGGRKIQHDAAEKLAPSRHRHLKIYFTDRDVIVVEKPAGILSVSSEGKSADDMVSEVKAFLSRRHQTSHGSFVSPLHRLDTETSGIMIFALSKDGKKLEDQFRSHAIRREYVAVVSGQVEESEGIIDIPLEKGDFHGGKKVRRAGRGEGKRAVTEFRVKERYGNATLLDVKVRTGRTHQIRVHLAEKGYPLLGDKLYSEGDRSFNRQALHAAVLGFRHPATGKKMLFHSPLPRDMRELVDKLRQG